MKRKVIKSFKDIQNILKNKLDVYDSEGNLVPYKIFLDFTLNDLQVEVFNKYTCDL